MGTLYYSDINRPIKELESITLWILLFSSISLVVLAFIFSNDLIVQLRYIIKGIENFYDTNTPFDMDIKSVVEFKKLGIAFHDMTLKLNENMVILKNKIVELRESQQEKAKVLDLIHNIMNSMPSVIIAIDEDFNIILWNDQATVRTNIDENTAIGKNLFEVYPDFLEIKQEFQIQNWNSDHTYPLKKRKNEKDRYDEITFFSYSSQGQKGAVIRIDDVTKRIKLESDLQHGRRMEAIGQLSGGIAHDFNNMLAGILTSIQLLELQLGKGKSVKKYIDMIIDAVTRSSELTKKLLDFSRFHNPVYQPLHLHEAIQNALSLLTASLDKLVSFELQLNAESDIVVGDLSQLQNIFINLGINSAHAMPEGGRIIVKTSLIDLDQDYCHSCSFDIHPGRYIHIEVIDEGVGIPEEYQDKIFEPFFTTKEQGKGTGLGLASVYGIINQHKGTIKVESTVNKGTSFQIDLPTNDSLVELKETREITKGEGKILLIEDEDILRTSMEELLSDMGYDIIVAENGKDGVNKYQVHEQEIDLVIMDMIMPVMNGREALGLLKKINNGVLVLFCSGYSRDEDINAIKEMGASGFISKPIDRVSLSRLIANTLHGRSL